GCGTWPFRRRPYTLSYGAVSVPTSLPASLKRRSPPKTSGGTVTDFALTRTTRYQVPRMRASSPTRKWSRVQARCAPVASMAASTSRQWVICSLRRAISASARERWADAVSAYRPPSAYSPYLPPEATVPRARCQRRRSASRRSIRRGDDAGVVPGPLRRLGRVGAVLPMVADGDLGMGRVLGAVEPLQVAGVAVADDRLAE